MSDDEMDLGDPKNWKTLYIDPAQHDREIKEKHVEVEDLKNRLLEGVSIMEDLIKDVDAKETELKALKELLEAQEIRVAALRQNRQEDDRIITELADALEVHSRWYPNSPIKELVRKARSLTERPTNE